MMGSGFFVNCRQQNMHMQATLVDPQAEESGKVNWFRRDVAYYLRRSRINAGLKQAEAGKFLGLSRSPVSSLELGDRELGLYDFFTLLQAYDVPLIIGVIHSMLIYQERRRLSKPDLDMLKVLICEMRARGHSLPVILTHTEYGLPPKAIRYGRD